MSTVDVIATPTNTEPADALVQEIGLDKIKPSKANPRRRTDDSALAELAASIKTHGILQPILVRPITARGFEIVCGERRWRASKTAGEGNISPPHVQPPQVGDFGNAPIQKVPRGEVPQVHQTLGFKGRIKQNPPIYTPPNPPAQK